MLAAAPAAILLPATWHGEQEIITECGQWSWDHPARVDTSTPPPPYSLCFEAPGVDPCVDDVSPGDTVCLPEAAIGITHRAYVVAWWPNSTGYYSDTTSVYRAPHVDYNGDLVVGSFDIFEWIEWWQVQDQRADVTGDELVDLFDLFMFLDQWMKCVSPNGVLYVEC